MSASMISSSSRSSSPARGLHIALLLGCRFLRLSLSVFGISLVGLFAVFDVVFLVLLLRLAVVVLVGLLCLCGLLLQWFLVPGFLAHLICYIFRRPRF